MNEQFVPYEIAKQLKEKGFDEPCFGTYGFNNINPKKLYLPEDIRDEFYERIDVSDIVNGINGDDVAAPLWQQVIDWLLETHKLYITITSCSQESWQFHIQKPGESLNTLWEEDFYSYREARQAAIEHALTLI